MKKPISEYCFPSSVGYKNLTITEELGNNKIMKFLIDENILHLEEVLSQFGECGIITGKSDTEILREAIKNKMTVITADKHFKHIKEKNHYGVIFLKPGLLKHSKEYICRRLTDFFTEAKEKVSDFNAKTIVLGVDGFTLVYNGVRKRFQRSKITKFLIARDYFNSNDFLNICKKYQISIETVNKINSDFSVLCAKFYSQDDLINLIEQTNGRVRRIFKSIHGKMLIEPAVISFFYETATNILGLCKGLKLKISSPDDFYLGEQFLKVATVVNNGKCYKVKFVDRTEYDCKFVLRKFRTKTSEWLVTYGEGACMTNPVQNPRR